MSEPVKSEWILSTGGEASPDSWRLAIRIDQYECRFYGWYVSAEIGDAKLEEPSELTSAFRDMTIAGAVQAVRNWINALPAKAKRGDRKVWVKAMIEALDGVTREASK